LPPKYLNIALLSLQDICEIIVKGI